MEKTPCNHYVKANGIFAEARYIRSKKHYRLRFFTPPATGERLGDPVLSQTIYSVEQVHRFRWLKHKPSGAQVRKAGW